MKQSILRLLFLGGGLALAMLLLSPPTCIFPSPLDCLLAGPIGAAGLLFVPTLGGMEDALLPPTPLAVLAVLFSVKFAVFCLLQRSMPSPAALARILTAAVLGFLAGGIVLTLNFFPVLCLPFLLAACFLPAKRLSTLKGWNLFLLLCGVAAWYLGHRLLFEIAQSKLYSSVSAGRSLSLYWILNYLNLFSALLFGAGFSTLWEDWTIASLLPEDRRSGFSPAVLWANLATLAVLLAWAALRILQERVHSPSYIVSTPTWYG